MGALRKNFPDATAVARAIDAALTKAEDDTEAEIVAEMSAAKHGTHWPGLPNTSSAPGEAPAIQSELLVDSLQVRPGPGGSVRLLITAPYAADLEFGAPARHLAARPFLIPAVHLVAPGTWTRMLKALRGKKA